MTLAPPRANSIAKHRPMPLEAPVTIARRSVRLRLIVVFGGVQFCWAALILFYLQRCGASTPVKISILTARGWTGYNN